MRVSLSFFALLFASSLSVPTASAGCPLLGGCGHQSHCCSDPCCCSSCCCGSQGSRGYEDQTRAAPAPQTQQVQVRSAPVSLAMPTLVSLPMFGSGLASASRSSSSSNSRIDDLEERVDSLHRRMIVIERAVEVQTEVLEEIKARGTIGGTPIPGGKPSDTEVPQPPSSVKAKLETTISALQNYVDQAEAEGVDLPEEEIENALKALQKYSEIVK